MKTTKTNSKRVDNVELTKGGYGNDSLYYEVDGVPYTVTGEFYIDKQGILHHQHDDDIEVTVKYEL